VTTDELAPEAVSKRAEAADAAPDPGDMHVARYRHSATLLPDGSVLVVGGAQHSRGTAIGLGAGALASAEHYSPELDSFERVEASLTDARWGHSATLLRDGRVLIVGGFDDQGAALASSELFDPSTRTFSPAAALSAARALHTATLLPDDRVLIAGGVGDLNLHRVRSVDVYQSGRFGRVEPGPIGSSFPHTVVLEADGKATLRWGDASVAESFDPASNSFAPARTPLSATDAKILGPEFSATRVDDVSTAFFGNQYLWAPFTLALPIPGGSEPSGWGVPFQATYAAGCLWQSGGLVGGMAQSGAGCFSDVARGEPS
jgi:hypothetical protein